MQFLHICQKAQHTTSRSVDCKLTWQFMQQNIYVWNTKITERQFFTSKTLQHIRVVPITFEMQFDYKIQTTLNAR